jgi:NadR type nicotinamide-nucleotide adenylyltransferase
MADRDQIGVAVGKFNPPHLGHVHLITTGALEVDHLHVILADRPDQTIPASDRAAWLADALPDNVTIIVTPDDLPLTNEAWARRAIELLPEPPTVAFTSEPWGPGWAEAMRARHVSIDVERAAAPISSTVLRADLRSNFEWLVPAARAGLARRVVVAGAESTGKTTLAHALAEHHSTVWVPEYGRLYWEGRRHTDNEGWTADEFTHIAETHHAVADRIARRAANGLVVLDTDALVTDVWRRRYLGDGDESLVGLATSRPPDLYLVCAPDFAWVQDGSRESEQHRSAMHDHTLKAIASTGVHSVILEGDAQRRLTHAIELVDELTTYPALT